jgi:hypothetical protein
MMRPAVLSLMMSLSMQAEIIDRTVATVGSQVVTRSDVIQHLRVQAFLDGAPLDLSPARQRQAVNRLVEQALIRHEVELSFYPPPDMADVDALVEKLRKPRLESDADFDRELRKYGITDEQLHQALQWQLTLLRFIEYRFRPGVQVSDADERAYYDRDFAPAARKQGGPVPAFEDVRDRIEKILVDRKVDEALDRWIEQARTQVTIHIHEEDFQ